MTPWLYLLLTFYFVYDKNGGGVAMGVDFFSWSVSEVLGEGVTRPRGRVWEGDTPLHFFQKLQYKNRILEHLNRFF